MNVKYSIFEETYQNYLAQLAGIDFPSKAEMLGIGQKDGEALIPLLGTIYQVSPKGVFDPLGKEPTHAVRVVLCRYLLLSPVTNPIGEEWVSYKDFKDAAPFVGGFGNKFRKEYFGCLQFKGDSGFEMQWQRAIKTL